MTALTPGSFERLLGRLDSNSVQAAEKYELLRQKLINSLIWKSCPESEAEALVDTAFDRIANKLSAGEEIKNITAYAGEVARFVWLEHIRRYKELAVGERLPEIAVVHNFEVLTDPDLRTRCLRKCLAEVVPDDRDRSLIIGYYDLKTGEKNKDHRKNLAQKLNLTMTTLKVKACRIRERLEKCINECVTKLSKQAERGN
jgi:DNA-directed RNA polymerase specialized sigma24 family protein